MEQAYSQRGIFDKEPLDKNIIINRQNFNKGPLDTV